MFNKVWGTPSFLIAVVQALGCYCLDGSYRHQSFLGVETRTRFPRLDSLRQTEDAAAGVGNPEIRVVQKGLVHRHHPLLFPPPARLMPACALGRSPGQAPSFSPCPGAASRYQAAP